MKRFPRFISTLILLAASFTALAQFESTRVIDYITRYRQLAIDEMLRTGVPASITLAQGILETAGGQSDLASVANNHFGIKCKSDWTGETMLHNDDAVNECFRKYPSVEDSYRDHSDFLKARPNYAFLFKLDPTDYEGWAKGLKKAGYATNPVYPQKLMKIIVDNNLQEVTLLALNGVKEKETSLFAMQPANPEVSKAENTIAVSDNLFESNSNIPVNASETTSQKEQTNSEYPNNQVFAINEAKVMFTKAGTSLLAVANNYNIAYKKLLEYNELNEIDIIEFDQLIFLQKKPKRGSKDIHIVADKETLRDISQKEGIQLISVLEFNRLQKGMEPAIGEKIYLKFPAPTSPKIAGVIRPGNVSTSMR